MYGAKLDIVTSSQFWLGMIAWGFIIAGLIALHRMIKAGK